MISLSELEVDKRVESAARKAEYRQREQQQAQQLRGYHADGGDRLAYFRAQARYETARESIAATNVTQNSGVSR